MIAQLEHANLTVPDPDATAAWMADIFGWHVRWAGHTEERARAIHVGSASHYLALFAAPGAASGDPHAQRYRTPGGVNHLGLVVGDLDATEARVRAAGFEPHHHADYEPGRRFYFFDDHGTEYEIVSYAA